MAICGICGKTETEVVCAICGIPICELDATKVTIAELHPSHMVRPGVVKSSIRPGTQIKKLCPNCIDRADELM